MQKILVVEDDIIICGGVKTFLENKGYSATCAYSLSDAREQLDKTYSLVILDVNLPDGNGLDFCKEIRNSENSQVAIIFLTAKDTNEDMIEGFKCGCDDYIAKPFAVEVLNQRIVAVLRRSTGTRIKEIFTYGELAVDFEKMQVFKANEPIKLSATEFRILEMLIRNKGRVITRKHILQEIWDNDENFVDENTLNVHIRRLRCKIENDAKNPIYVVTVFGIGYTFGD